jgi:carboxypeptidase Taq
MSSSEPTDAAYQRLVEHAREVALLASVESLLGWDERTMLPAAAGPYRADQATYVAGLLHRRQTDPRVADWLAELANSPLTQDPHSDAGATYRWLRRRYERKTKLPQTLVEHLARTAVLGQQAWAKARRDDDFASFAPLLETTFALKREEAEAVGYEDCPYDALLDDYEPFEKISRVGTVLRELRDATVPLLEAIVGSGRQPRADVLERHYPIAVQKSFGHEAAGRIGFDFERGRIDETDHPFCCTVGPHDIRITTRYDDRAFNTALFGILHEAGHGIYEQGLPPDAYGLPLGEAVSLGIHESQSRLWENQVGRGRGFWELFYGRVQDLFASALADVPLDDFYFAVNQVRPSLIRVEADELTYNLHILVRCELEQALLNDDLKVSDLPAAWNEQYRDTLGVSPQNDAEGVLQDIHWSAGLVGYFATYTLGNLYAAQFFEQADKELGGLDVAVRQGDFTPLRDWLRERIHTAAQRYTASELVVKVTGAPLTHDPLVRHLRSKLEPLYGVS